MRRFWMAALTVAAVMTLGSARAEAYTIGIGEQRTSMFEDPLWRDLGLKEVRFVVGWDATSTKWQRNEIDAYMAAAERGGARVLVAFGRSRVPSRNRVLPTVASYRRAFRAFRKRWPSVTQFIPWNEANHCSQPTCHREDMAAAYYKTIKRACRSCTVVAADVLDTPDMEGWLRNFLKHAGKGPHIWGLHNYLDANQFRTSGTRTMLRTVPGQIWFTETGGLVRRSNRSPIKFPDSVPHAARATRWVFKRLAPLSPRVQRVYFYHWSHPGEEATWDSALLNAHGVPRLAYKVLRDQVRRQAQAAAAGASRAGA